MRFFNKALYTLGFVISVTGLCHAANDNQEGRAFMISFIPNFDPTIGQNGLVVTARWPTKVYVKVPSVGTLSTYSLEGNSSLFIQLHPITSVSVLGVPVRQAVSVYSTLPVSVYCVTTEPRSSEAFLAIPVDKWGDHYVVATYDGAVDKGGEILIIGAEDDTSLTVHLKTVTSTRCLTRQVDGGLIMSYTVGREEVLRLSCDKDLTGTIVKASKPVGVIAGNGCTTVPAGSKFCDHLVEMMLPSSWLGLHYIIPAPVLPGRANSRIRIVYTEDTSAQTAVVIRYKGPAGRIDRDTRLYKEIIVPSGTVVELDSNKPILVVLYLTAPEAELMDEFGGPAMVVVVPTDRYATDFVLSFNWSLLVSEDLNFHLSSVVDGQEGSGFVKGADLNSQEAFGYSVVQSTSPLPLKATLTSMVTPREVIVMGDLLVSTIAFPVGMKMDNFSDTDHCLDHPCFHQGICFNHGFGAKCFCGFQLTGHRCELDVYDACSSQPCQHGGECFDLPVDFNCVCSNGYTGRLCESEIREEKEVVSENTQTQSLCSCECKNVTKEVMEEKTKEIEKELEVDVKTTTKFIRRKESASDTRPSAQGIGILGVVFLTLVFGSVFLLDLSSFVAYMVTTWRDHKSKQKLSEEHGEKKKKSPQKTAKHGRVKQSEEKNHNGVEVQDECSASEVHQNQISKDYSDMDVEEVLAVSESDKDNASVTTFSARFTDRVDDPLTYSRSRSRCCVENVEDSLTKSRSRFVENVDDPLTTSKSRFVEGCEDEENQGKGAETNKPEQSVQRFSFLPAFVLNLTRIPSSLWSAVRAKFSKPRRESQSCSEISVTSIGHSRSSLSMPRIQITSDGLQAVGHDGNAFQARRPSWLLKKHPIQVEPEVMSVKEISTEQDFSDSSVQC